METDARWQGVMRALLERSPSNKYVPEYSCFQNLADEPNIKSIHFVASKIELCEYRLKFSAFSTGTAH